MTPIFEMSMRVRDYEVDSQGIVNNAVYLRYMEHTRHEFCRNAGCEFRTLQAMGVDPVVSHIDITYMSPLRLADQMTSSLSMSRRGARFLFDQEIKHIPSQRLVARATVTIVCLENGRLTRGDILAEKFAKYL